MLVLNWLSIQNKSLNNRLRQNARTFFLSDTWHTLIILGGLALFYIFLNAMFGFIDRKGMPAFDFAFVLLSFSLLVFLPLLVYSAIVCSLSFLFQKEELHFYFSLPVNRLSVFTIKFLQTYFHTNWMVFLGFFTFLAAIQNYFKASPLIYLTGSISFLIYLLIPVCLAVLLVIVISRFIPFVRSKGMLTVIGLLVGGVLLSAIRVMQPERLVTAEGKMRLVTFVQNLYKPWMTWLPSEWVTNILFAQSQNNAKGITVNFLSLLIAVSLLLFAVYIAAQFFYKKAWADSVVMSPAVGKEFTWQAGLKFFPVALRGFIRKDLLIFSRDTLEKGSLILLVPLAFVYLYSMRVLYRQVQNTNIEQIFSFLYIYLFNFFYASVVIAALSGRWVLPSISSEGNNFKLIKGSPTSLKYFLKAKFYLGFIPLLFVGEILILCSSIILHLPWYFVLVSALTMAVLCEGITVIALVVGMKQADFSISSPLEFALSANGLLCLVWEFIFVSAILILVIIPTVLFLSKGLCAYFILALMASILMTVLILKMIYRQYKSSLLELSRKQI